MNGMRAAGSRPPRWSTSLVSLAVVVALAGCGGPRRPVDAAVAAALSNLSQTASWHLTLDAPSAFGKTDVPFRAAGVSVFNQGIGYAALDFSHIEGHHGGVEYLDFRPAELAFAPSPAGASLLPRGKTWVSLGLDASIEHTYPRLVEQVEALDPHFLLDEIGLGAVSVTDERSEVVDHLPLTRYVVLVDLEAALSQLPAASAGEKRALADELSALPRGRSTTRVTIWVDGPGHLARLQAAIPGSGLGTVQLTFGGFGSSLRTTTFPAASQVVPLIRLLSVAPPPRSPLATFGAGP